MKCFYHKVDHDGQASAAIIKNIFPECELYPINYDMLFPFDKINKDESVFLVDFCIQPYKNMINLKELTSNLIWIDHHKSAIESSIELGFDDIDGIRDIQYSGCELVWKYFNHGKLIPKAINLIGRYDVWDHSNENIIPFEYGLKGYDTDPTNHELWINLINNNNDIIDKIIYEGKIIYNFIKQSNSISIKSKSYHINFHDYNCIIINKGGGSKIFDSIYNNEDIMMTYFYNGTTWIVSLYTNKDNIDVSKIAKLYGGGGHKKAAGFNTDNITPLLNNV